MQIFLSYASDHHSIAKEIALALRELGHTVFFDKSDLPPAQSYHSRVRKAVNQCDRFIYLISPESIAEGRYTLTELRYAEERWRHPGDHVLPVVIKPVEIDKIPEYLRAVSLLEPTGNIPAEIQAVVARWHSGSKWKRTIIIGLPVLIATLFILFVPGMLDTIKDWINHRPPSSVDQHVDTTGVDTSKGISGPDTAQVISNDRPSPMLFGTRVVINYTTRESLARRLKRILNQKGAQAEIRRVTFAHPHYSGGIVFQPHQERKARYIKNELKDEINLDLHLTQVMQAPGPLVIYLQ